MNQYAAARNAYAEASVMTATPERLVVMLYDGAIRFLNQAAAALRDGQHIQSRRKLHSARAIIEELNRSLDLRQGEVAHGLRSIYSFCLRHLIDATAASDPDGYDKVAALLADLRESWVEIEASSERQTA